MFNSFKKLITPRSVGLISGLCTFQVLKRQNKFHIPILHRSKPTYDLSLVNCLTGPSLAGKLQGEYQNRIRRSSPPEKIFELFANVSEGGTFYMSHEDLFQALIPYNYTDTDEEEYEQKEDDFMSQAIIDFADVDKDGKISLYEYYYFVIFMQATKEKFLEFFGKDEEISQEDLKGFFEQI